MKIRIGFELGIGYLGFHRDIYHASITRFEYTRCVMIYKQVYPDHILYNDSLKLHILMKLGEVILNKYSNLCGKKKCELVCGGPAFSIAV